MNEPTMETLARRLDRVERPWREIGVAVLMVVTFALLLGARGQKVAEEVRAKRFVLVDEKGKIRGTLGVEPKGTAQLELSDEKGMSRAWLAVTPKGMPMLFLSDENVPRAMLSLDDDGTPWLSLHDGKGETRAGLTFLKDQGSLLKLHDEKGRFRALLRLDSDGKPEMVFFDKAEKSIWHAPGQQVAGSSRLWILWARAFAGQYTETMALTTWPTKNQCEQDRTARLSKITREPGSGINFVCLPEGIDPRGTDRILLLDLFRFHP